MEVGAGIHVVFYGRRDCISLAYHRGKFPGDEDRLMRIERACNGCSLLRECQVRSWVLWVPNNEQGLLGHRFCRDSIDFQDNERGLAYGLPRPDSMSHPPPGRQ